MNCTTKENTYGAQGEEFIENPDYVAEVPAHWDSFKKNIKWTWTGGPEGGAPESPLVNPEGWNLVGETNDIKGRENPDTVIQAGKGNADYFYYQSGVWAEGTPAIGEEFIKNPEYVPAWTEQVETCTPPIVICPEGKVPGWLDEFGNAQGCVDNNPTPPVKPEEPVITPEEPETTPKEETPPTPEAPADIVTETIQVVTTAETPELAVTGGVDGLSAALFGAVLLIAGVGLMMKRKEA